MTPRNCGGREEAGDGYVSATHLTACIANSGGHLLRQMDCENGPDSLPFAVFTLVGQDLTASLTRGLESISSLLGFVTCSGQQNMEEVRGADSELSSSGHVCTSALLLRNLPLSWAQALASLLEGLAAP